MAAKNQVDGFVSQMRDDFGLMGEQNGRKFRVDTRAGCGKIGLEISKSFSHQIQRSAEVEKRGDFSVFVAKYRDAELFQMRHDRFRAVEIFVVSRNEKDPLALFESF